MILHRNQPVEGHSLGNSLIDGLPGLLGLGVDGVVLDVLLLRSAVVLIHAAVIVRNLFRVRGGISLLLICHTYNHAALFPGGERLTAAVGIGRGRFAGVRIDIHVRLRIGVGIRVSVHVRSGVSIRIDVHIRIGVSIRIDVHIRIGVSIRIDVHIWIRVSIRIDVHIWIGVSIRIDVHIWIRVGIRVNVNVRLSVGIRVNINIRLSVSIRVNVHIRLSVGIHIAVLRGRDNSAVAVGEHRRFLDGRLFRRLGQNLIGVLISKCNIDHTLLVGRGFTGFPVNLQHARVAGAPFALGFAQHKTGRQPAALRHREQVLDSQGFQVGCQALLNGALEHTGIRRLIQFQLKILRREPKVLLGHGVQLGVQAVQGDLPHSHPKLRGVIQHRELNREGKINGRALVQMLMPPMGISLRRPRADRQQTHRHAERQHQGQQPLQFLSHTNLLSAARRRQVLHHNTVHSASLRRRQLRSLPPVRQGTPPGGFP
ncbi:MAG: hypothetical protein K2O93_01595, partial [Oscillospiraceae bacterium]|nr:hypothetical protein [Oscillospiraceae bacterium]